MSEKIYIPGELISAEKDGFVTATSEIADRVGGVEKTQRQINADVAAALVTIQEDINTLRGMTVVALDIAPSTLTASADKVYLWKANAVDVAITLNAPSDATKVAVYSFFVKTGTVAPEITLSCDQEYSVVTPIDWEVQTNNWSEIEVMLVGNVFFARIMNYGEQQV